VSGVEAFPVAGDDEEGVVDADAEPDHDPEDGGVVGDGEDVGEQQGHPHTGGDPAEGDGDREAHGEHRPECQDQDDHGEGETEELGLRGLDHRQVLAAGEDLEAVDRRGVLADRLAELAGLGVVDVGRQVHLRVGHSPGQGAVEAIWLSPRRVGRDHGRARMLRHTAVVGESGVDRCEQVLHGGPDLGIVDALGCSEHDRARLPAGAELGEVLSEHGEPGSAAGAGHRRSTTERWADGPGGREDDEEDRSPEPDGRSSVVEAPAAESSEHGVVAGRGVIAVPLGNGWWRDRTVVDRRSRHGCHPRDLAAVAHRESGHFAIV
jgi:hypothetical protein